MRAIYEPSRAELCVAQAFPEPRGYLEVPDKCAMFLHKQTFGIRLDVSGKPYIDRLVDCRWYTTRYHTATSKVYCRVFLKDFGVMWGKQGGHAGHKVSWAFGSALSAYVKLYDDTSPEPGSVAGCGDLPVAYAIAAMTSSFFPDAKYIKHFD